MKSNRYRHKYRIITIFFTLIIIGIVQLSCIFGYDCQGYDVSDKSIVAFRQNDTIVYISDKQDTLRLVVINFYAEDASETKGFYTTYDCRPEAYYSTKESRGISIKEKHTWDIQIFFCTDKQYDILWASEKSHDLMVEYTQDKEIQGVIYSFVWEVKDMSNQRRIDRFIKVSNHGIIEFHDKITGLTWTQCRKL
ncbi:MAG: hypothetical protein LBT50_00715 [Prevotellaceae bacterium]|jgi:uncharacterized ubiquitin-like protein YukD|nr:hypothetical protein [Prevotellaceae bacterium]